MTPQEQLAFDHLAGRKTEMLRLLDQLVSIDSQSRCVEGINAVSAAIAAFLQARGIDTQALPNATYGNGLRASIGVPTGRSEAPVVLMGHCDTVFPSGEALRRPFHISEGKAHGPGVADMKAGLVMNAFVLEALAKLDRLPFPVTALFTVDEEIGSPWSRTPISETCRNARAVFNSEPGRPTGNIVTGRKGGFFFRIEIAGKAAHSGVNIESGVNAVSEAARKIIALEALSDPDSGITVNAGMVQGGSAFNIVAPSALLEAEVRYRNSSDRAGLLSAIRETASRSFIKGTVCELKLHGEFPPMEAGDGSRPLAALYAEAASAAGLTVDCEFSGGCSDAGFASLLGVPTLCAVGPVGGYAHTDNEYVDIDTLVPRAQALALTILRCTNRI